MPFHVELGAEVRIQRVRSRWSFPQQTEHELLQLSSLCSTMCLLLTLSVVIEFSLVLLVGSLFLIRSVRTAASPFGVFLAATRDCVS